MQRSQNSLVFWDSKVFGVISGQNQKRQSRFRLCHRGLVGFGGERSNQVKEGLGCLLTIRRAFLYKIASHDAVVSLAQSLLLF
jgi:hypothetical protein